LRADGRLPDRGRNLRPFGRLQYGYVTLALAAGGARQARVNANPAVTTLPNRARSSGRLRGPVGTARLGPGPRNKVAQIVGASSSSALPMSMWSIASYPETTPDDYGGTYASPSRSSWERRTARCARLAASDPERSHLLERRVEDREIPKA